MSRYLLTIRTDGDRHRARRLVDVMPLGGRIELKSARRTIPQNSKLWASLSEVALQLPWHGQRLTPDDWKLIFLDALKREVHPVPNLDGTGFVNIGRSSSDLSREEMGDLIELIHEFGARHGVKFHDQVAA